MGGLNPSTLVKEQLPFLIYTSPNRAAQRLDDFAGEVIQSCRAIGGKDDVVRENSHAEVGKCPSAFRLSLKGCNNIRLRMGAAVRTELDKSFS